MLSVFDYDTPPWPVVEQAAPGRIRLTAAPGTGTAKPAGNSMRVTLRPGDIFTDGDGYQAARAEVYGRAPIGSLGSTPAEQWPDPVGSERWYAWSLLVPAGFQLATDDRWLVCTQWKGLRGGGPPVGVEIKRSGLRLGGTRANAGLLPDGPNGNLGLIQPGVWTRLVVGMFLSPDPAQGWATVLRDGKTLIPKTSLATMDLIGGQPDPIYFKQGIYRDELWTCPHTLYFGPVSVADSPLI